MKAHEFVVEQYCDESNHTTIGVFDSEKPKLSAEHSAALWSIVTHNLYLRMSHRSNYAHPELVLHSRPMFPEDGWSMQTGMVGRNAEAYRNDMELQEARFHLYEIEGWWPLGWRRNEWEEVDGDFIDNVYMPIVIELVF